MTTFNSVEKDYYTMNDLDKAMKVVSDESNPLDSMAEKLQVPVKKLEAYREDPQSLKGASWSLVHSIAGLYDGCYPSEGYFKVEDPEAHESGWALYRNHQVILTNKFMNFESGTRLVLEDDDYTINIPATRAINKNNY